jgi:hypothetical protein
MHTERLPNKNMKRFIRRAAGAVLYAAVVLAMSEGAGAGEQPMNVAASRADGSSSIQAGEARKIRVIDITTAGAATSDGSHWHNRVAKPAVAKNATATVAASKPEKTKKAVRRALTREPEARSAFAAAPNERGSFGLFFQR